MKNLFLFISIFYLLFGLTSCEKEQLLPLEISSKTMVNSVGVTYATKAPSPEHQQHFTIIDGNEPDSDCPYRKCEDEIAYWVAYYQPIANETGVTQWFDITCCSDGNVTYALCYVAPNNIAQEAEYRANL